MISASSVKIQRFPDWSMENRLQQGKGVLSVNGVLVGRVRQLGKFRRNSEVSGLVNGEQAATSKLRVFVLSVGGVRDLGKFRQHSEVSGLVHGEQTATRKGCFVSRRGLSSRQLRSKFGGFRTGQWRTGCNK